jgi:putative ABC transport system permease protein
MNFGEHIQQARLHFMASKLRSGLAMLGILVGTAAVVALISSGKLATQTALAQFKAMGTDLLAVSLYQQSENQTTRGKNHIPLTLWRQFPQLIPGIKDIAPYSSAYQSISFEGHPITGPIIGADNALARIIHIRLTRGHFVSPLESFEHHCVIGDKLAHQLEHISFGDPLGRQLQIGNSLYTIVGIAKPWKENAFFNEDINQAIIVPIAGIALVSESSQVSHAILLLNPTAPVDAVIEAVKKTIKKQAPKLSVFARSAKQIIAGMESQGRIFTLLLTTIGGISLFVGGIGIMNVMLVSVSERKQEIGIRKALGATRHQIQSLFLIEAILLSVVGGALGIILGLFATWMIAIINHWPFTLYTLPLIAGFIVSVATGIFFGFYPARRAAQLDPVISLRGS